MATKPSRAPTSDLESLLPGLPRRAATGQQPRGTHVCHRTDTNDQGCHAASVFNLHRKMP